MFKFNEKYDFNKKYLTNNSFKIILFFFINFLLRKKFLIFNSVLNELKILFKIKKI